MKILVCIKAVPEVAAAVTFHPDAPAVVVDHTTLLRMNRFDEFAVEEAVRIKSRFPGAVIDVVSVGPENAQKIIQRAMGMGADAGYHFLSGYVQSCNAHYAAGCIAAFAAQQSYDLILTGVMSEDMMQFQTGPMIAQRLHVPWATSVIYENIGPDQKTVYVEREMGAGVREQKEISLPAVLTLQSGINAPRYPSVSKLLRAMDAGVTSMPAESFMRHFPMLTNIGYLYPKQIRQGLILKGTTREKAVQLLHILHEKGLLP